MARLFLRLKLRLLANSLRLGWQQTAGLVLAVVFVLPLSVLAAIALAVAGRAGGESVVGLPAVAFLGLGGAWVVLPVIAFGVDETLDPSRLQLLPLRRSQLARGLLAASLIGAGAIGTSLVLVGAVVGFAPPSFGAVIVIAAAVGQLLLCVLSARVVTTLLSLRLRSRRGRDTVGAMAALAGVGFSLLLQLTGPVLSSGEQLARISDVALQVAAFVPFGWAARSVAAAAAGDLGPALLWLLAAAAAVAVLAQVWLRALEWAMTAAPPPATRSGSDEDLFPRAVRWLPRNRVGGSIAKELRYFSRLPQLRVGLLMQPLFAVGAVVTVAVVDPLQQPEVVLIAPVFGMLFGLVALNALGPDGRALWLVVATGRMGWLDLAAKNAALAIIVLPLVTLVTIALAALTSGWIYAVPSIALAVVVLAVTTGVGNVSSVLAPQPLPESPVNAFAATQGAGCATALIQLVSLTIVGLLLVPVVVGVFFSVVAAPAFVGLVAVLALLWAGGAWVLGTRLAGSQLRVRGPDIVVALTPRGQ